MRLNIERQYTEDTTVLNTDTYDRMQFALITNKAEKLYESVEKAAKENTDMVSLMGDMFASLFKMKPALKSQLNLSNYEPLTKKDIIKGLMIGEDKETQEVNPINEELISRILIDQNYKKMRRTTKLDEFSSALGTMYLSEMVSEWIKDQRNHDEEFNKMLNQLKNLKKEMNSNQNDIQKRNEEGKNPTKKQSEKKEQLKGQHDQLQQQITQAISRKIDGSTMSQIIEKANQEIKKQKEDLNSLLGGGAGSGEVEMKKLPLNEQLKLASVLRDSEDVREIAEWAGQFKAIARKKQKVKHTESVDRSGMTLGNDIERLLAQELGQFVKTGTKLDFLRRFSEGQTMMFSPEGKETLAKGPIVMCLDESGSMAKIINQAKGFCLAIAMIAKKQGRDFCLIPFSNRTGEKLVCEKGKVTTEHIISLASNFLGGGTHYMPPLNEAVKYIQNNKRFKKADIIFVTDGDPSDTGALNKGLPNFIQQKQKFAINIMSLLIGGTSSEYVERFSDKVINAEDFTADNASEIFLI